MEIPRSSNFNPLENSNTLKSNNTLLGNNTLENIRDTNVCNNKQLLVSCMIGNALEWYDFIIYGYFVVTFGALFFPGASSVLQLLASWGVFWAGFIARPLGSIIFGYIGDKKSRKTALTWSIYFMAIPTALMGCLPIYEQVGLIAPISLILLRTLQGFAIGGEFTSTMVFLVEHAPGGKRGFWGSFAAFSAVMGVILGSLLVAGLNSFFTPETMQTWGWRIPFILSVLGSIVGAYMRSRLVDPNIFLLERKKYDSKYMPLKQLLQHYKSNIGIIFLLDFLNTIGFFIVVVFLSTYFRTHLKIPINIALTIHTFSMCVFAIFILIGGTLSDSHGRKPVLGFPCIGFMILSYPLFLMLQTENYYIIAFVQSTLAIMMGIFFGVIPTALAEIMPTKIRCSGVSIAHSISVAIFGGGAPFFATHLIHYTENLAAPSYLLIAASFLSLCSLPFIKDCDDIS